MERVFELHSHDLLSKWGFGDGDLFNDFVFDNNYHVRWTTQEFPIDKEILKRVVETYLIPALPYKVRLQCVVTMHNCVRVHPDDYEELQTQPEIVVKVSEQQVREICEQVKEEYLKYNRIGETQ